MTRRITHTERATRALIRAHMTAHCADDIANAAAEIAAGLVEDINPATLAAFSNHPSAAPVIADMVLKKARAILADRYGTL